MVRAQRRPALEAQDEAGGLPDHDDATTNVASALVSSPQIDAVQARTLPRYSPDQTKEVSSDSGRAQDKVEDDLR